MNNTPLTIFWRVVKITYRSEHNGTTLICRKYLRFQVKVAFYVTFAKILWVEIKFRKSYFHKELRISVAMLLLNIPKVLYGIKYLRMDQVKFFDCLPQILLGPFLNTLSLMVQYYMDSPSVYSIHGLSYGRLM